MSYKSKIKNGFSRAKHSYDQSCQIQQKVCENLINLSKKHIKTAKTMVDLGCGTGNSTVLLKENITHKTVCALDISGQLITQARKKEKLNDVVFLEEDMDNLSFNKNTVDLFFSNMAMQWITNFSVSFTKIHQQLKQNGFFVFSLPINNTFNELKPMFRHNFHQTNNIVTQLDQSGLQLIQHSIENYTLKFSSAFSALQSIKRVGANQLNHERPQIKTKGLITKNDLSKYFCDENCFNLTYQIGYFISQKKEHL